MTETTSQDNKPQAPFDPVPLIAQELGLPARGVAAVAQLLAENATVPFIARYRKEVTGGLDEVQIRDIQEKRSYLIELEDRRVAILAEIGKQGKLTPELAAKIVACMSKTALEDLYLPYKPKRRTRAMIAKERGLEPLALKILAQEAGDPEAEAAAFVDAAKEVPSVQKALEGARDIVAEVLAESADALSNMIRDSFEYAHDVTGVRTTASEAWQLRAGVCQDMAHVMIAMCSSLGIAARYVSGHLVGDGASHAWVEIADPAHGRVVAIDPTHRRRTDLRYVTTATGRDYRDVAPTSGTYRGEGARATLTVRVAPRVLARPSR